MNMDTIESQLKAFLADKKAEVVDVALTATILLIILGYVFAPIGLTAMAGVNTTAAGVATGTNNSIWTAIVPIVLAALILAIVYMVKRR